jgi:hypothetical protein
MRSEKGITLTTVVIYVMAMIVIVGIVATITSFFYSNTAELEETSSILGEFNKFNLYFLSETQKEDNKVVKIESGKRIIFSSGAAFTYQDNGIYFNNIKLCSGVTDCTFSMTKKDEKDIILVYLEIGKNKDFARTMEYTLKYSNQFAASENEGDYTGNNTMKYTEEGVPVPPGFSYLTGTKNTGLVITDGINEFVWVPCTIDGANGTVKYEKWTSSVTGISHTDTTDDTLPTKVTNEWKQTETDQIRKYGGFYIARYEAGIPETMTTAINNANAASRNVAGTPVSKKNSVPWNYIDYTKAKANAERMYSSSQFVQGGLVTGRQWDAVMKWLENAGYNVQTNSTPWGNYSDASVAPITDYSTDYGATWQTGTIKPNGSGYILRTGNSEYTKANNIYDLAGNVWELTNEIYASNRSVSRSGRYHHPR